MREGIIGGNAEAIGLTGYDSHVDTGFAATIKDVLSVTVLAAN